MRNISNRAVGAKTLDYSKPLTSKSRKNHPKPATFLTPTARNRGRFTRNTSIVRQVGHRKRLESHFRSPFLRRKLSNLIQDSTIRNVKFNSSIFEKLRSAKSLVHSMPTLFGNEITEDILEKDESAVNNKQSALVLSDDDVNSPVKVSSKPTLIFL